ncbi:DUF3137 domain-containing protein [Calidithermus timidus]|jgi:type IV secretory pathway TrbD component|uniref:DUF3137 domain-containing protein n=1 Tax=Calidithermus timidus TaxID=307124 RepID=UPI00037BB7EC|nr:DUF3137 domain-containing protein [Calidithermus timidus]
MDFTRLYYQVLLPAQNLLERERRHSLLLVGLLTLFTASLLALGLAVMLAGVFPIGLLLLGLAAGTWLSVYPALQYNYRRHFKQKLIQPILAEVAPTLIYQSLGTLNELELWASGLLERTSEVEGSDLVRGRIEGVECKFAYVEAFAVEEKRDKNSSLKRRSRLFRGLLFVADFPKPFSGQVLIIPDHLEPTLGPLAHSLQSLDRSKGELVKLEDPDFEELFAVYTAPGPEQQIKARYLLSTSFMRRLAQFRRQLGRPLLVSLNYGKLYLAIPMPANPLDPPLLRKAVEVGKVREYVEALELMLGLVEELRLNVRIWSPN